uniref:RRM domain-containing protein n=1 Tax=Panagrolaimus superbus TaxID=310955 RepID=A0A914ZC67_9BILA
MATRTSQIGYDTNSKDVERMKARVFVAGLGHNVSRDQIIELFACYGHITGATLFKGYAFIQYSNSTEADLATMALNGYTWNKSMLEVKCAFDPAKGGDLMPTKRPKRDGGPPEKRAKIDKNYQQQNQQQQQQHEPAAIAPSMTNNSTPVIQQAQANINQIPAQILLKTDIIPDMFICGGCQLYTNSFEAFIEHRQIPCSTSKSQKSEGEPEQFRCFTCSNAFITSWELLYHLRVSHEITMYKNLKDKVTA